MFKRGQLIAIEFKYFMTGFGIGIVLALVLTWLGTTGVLPFKIPLVCGLTALFGSKKAQLGIIEMKFFFMGLIVGIILALVLVWLGTAGILPFQIPLVCSA